MTSNDTLLLDHKIDVATSWMSCALTWRVGDQGIAPEQNILTTLMCVPEEIRDGCLEERPCGVLDQEEQGAGAKMETVSCKGTIEEPKQERRAIYCHPS